MKHGKAANESPIFIFSCERSGSTLLRYVLDTHPKICCPAELSLGPLCNWLLKTVESTLGRVADVSDEEERRRIVLAEVRRVVDDLMGKYAAAKGKPIWCEKGTLNVFHLDLLRDVFPDARYLCLHRNSMDVVYSAIEVSRLEFLPGLVPYVQKSSGNVVEAMIDAWTDKTARLLAFERQNPESSYRLTYESLVLNPAKALMPLFEFLMVEWVPELLDRVFTSEHEMGPGDPKVAFSRGIHQKSLGKGASIPRSYIPDDLLERMNGLLGQLGYPIVGADWGFAPSPFSVEDLGPGVDLSIARAEQVFSDYIPRQLQKWEDARNGNGSGDVNGKGLKATFKFVVTGEEGGVWLLEMGESNGQVLQADGKAECVITISANDLVDVANGTLNPSEAFYQDRVQIAGDEELAMSMAQALFNYAK